MKWMIRWNILSEIAVRLSLWTLFIYFEHTEPFVREIHPNEAWMYHNPVTLSYVPSRYLWMLIASVPAAIFLGEYFSSGKREDAQAALLSTTLAYVLNGCITSYLKILVGRPRPDFHFRCFPDGNGDNYRKCEGTKRACADGRKSFPSGHSSFAFTAMTFATLYLARKLKLFNGSRQNHSWQLCICILPLLIAATVAVSRTCDYHHHYEDVIAGSLLGSIISYLSFRLYFPKDTNNEIPQA